MILPEYEAELVDLAVSYGQPHREIATLPSAKLFNPLNKADRIGEVCMVVQRPTGQLLTARKTFYPPEAYRLLTGGISHGEAIKAALLRETYEETGLEVVIQRFLAVIEYQLASPYFTPVQFTTFAFLLAEKGGNLECLDEHEKNAGFREIWPAELTKIANFLEHITEDSGSEINQGRWRDWGIFRAITHRVVYAALNEEIP